MTEIPLTKKVSDVDERLTKLEAQNPSTTTKKPWLKIKIPGSVKRHAKKAKQTNAIAIWHGSNKSVDFREARIKDGLIIVGDKEFAYEPEAVYYHKKWPVVTVYEWRLLPFGGRVEEYRRLAGDKIDQDIAKRLNIESYAQQTIIRGIERGIVQDDKVKSKGPSIIIWLLIGVGAIYVISKFFGG